jgi:two-component system sensor histidine kinase UhpB
LPVDKTLSQDEFLFLGAISDQVSVAIENAYLYEDLKQQNARVRALSQQLVENAENERRQVAHDLHDMVGQYLTALGINLNILKQKWAASAPDKVMARLEECTQLVERTTDYIRRLMADLRPPVLDDYGLFPALGWLGERFAQRMDLQVDVVGRPLSSRPDPHVEMTLFRIVQEALTNVVKHAKASRAEVVLEESDGRITLQVKDNGVGFDPSRADRPSERGGWGLFAIREWTEALGGRFELRSAPGEGTTLRVIWQRD